MSTKEMSTFLERVMRATGLSAEELEKLREEYRARNDRDGLMKYLQEVAQKKGNRLFVVEPPKGEN